MQNANYFEGNQLLNSAWFNFIIKVFLRGEKTATNISITNLESINSKEQMCLYLGF